MIVEWVAYASLGLAALPTGLALVNLCVYRTPRPAPDRARDPVSVLIPARNEASRIGRTLDAVLRDPNPALEVVVMDDDSEDRTIDVVRERGAQDPRVRLERAPPLPPGWNGKQHACRALAAAARHDVLVFLDADVSLEHDALPRALGFLDASGSDLVSGFPRQVTQTFLERLLIPLIHFVLLGFLPIPAMRWSRSAGFGAGCGQWMIVRRRPYEAIGGHGAVRRSRHDGVTLPRAFRRGGYRTDLFDATALAACRMYASGREVVAGLMKNATEGMAAPGAIVPWSVLLLGGQVVPFVLLAVFLGTGVGGAPLWAAGAAIACAVLTRVLLALRFRQPWDSVVLHPYGVLSLVALQWAALVRRVRGRPVAWKGRGEA